MRFWALWSGTILVLVYVKSASACPFCESEIGEQVNAGIFNAEFWYNAFLTLLPIPVLLGIVALIHFGAGWHHRPEPTAASNRRSEPMEPAKESPP